jgi:hypothetical protein
MIKDLAKSFLLGMITTFHFFSSAFGGFATNKTKTKHKSMNKVCWPWQGYCV